MLSIEIYAHVVKAMWFPQCLVSGWPALTFVNLRGFLGTKSEKIPIKSYVLSWKCDSCNTVSAGLMGS